MPRRLPNLAVKLPIKKIREGEPRVSTGEKFSFSLGRRTMATVRNEGDFRRAFAELIDVYYQLFLAEPVLRDIWSAAQADKALRNVQLFESRRNGALVADGLKRLRPDADPAAVERSAFVVMHLGEETMRPRRLGRPH